MNTVDSVETTLKLFIDNAPLAIAMFDKDMRYLAVSHRWITNHRLEKMNIIGRSHYDIFPDAPERWKVAHKRALAGEVMENQADRFKTKEGSVHWLRWVLQPWKDSTGSVGGVILFSEDVTDKIRAEEMLKASEERFETTFKSSPSAVGISRMKDGHFIDVNTAFVKLYGYSREEVIGHTSNELGLWHSQNRQLMINELQRNHHVENFELRGRRKTGEILDLLASAELITLEGEQCILGSLTDITVRKQAEMEREVTVELLKFTNDSLTIEELIRAATAFFQKCSGCEAVGIRLKEGNDYPYYETRGFPTEFVNSEKWLCARDSSGSIIHDDNGNPVLECMCGNVISGRFDPSKPFFTPNGSFWSNCTTDLLASTSEKDRQSRTRNRCNGEGYESVALIPIGFGGESLGLLQLNDSRKDRFTIETITLWERLADYLAITLVKFRAEEALRQGEQWRSLALESAQAGTWEWNVRTNTNIWSDELWSLYGLERGSCESSHEEWLKIVHPEDREKTEQIQREAINKHDAYNTEWRVKYHDGTIRWLMSRARPIKDTSGQVVRYLGTVIDITDLKNTEEKNRNLQKQLIQAQKMEAIGTLAGGIAHDFNNMLGVILGHVELAIEEVKTGSSIHTDLEEIQKAAQRSANLTRQLLAFARKQNVVRKVIDLNDTIADMTKMLRRLIGEDINLALIPGVSLWPVKIDPAQIDQLLANLCVNARDAVKGVGKITIETENIVLDEEYCGNRMEYIPGDYVMLAVSDDGCGMDQGTKEKLFEPFFTTKPVGEGTGLGLATVYGIVKQNEGQVEVYSEPGQGTSFKIYLPRASEDVHEKRNSSVQSVELGSETVLLVEDEEAILRLAKLTLERLGYKVLAAQSPIEALAIVDKTEEPIDLLITDVVMPDMNGQQLKEQIKQKLPKIKVLFMSGYTSDAMAHRGIIETDVQFLQKPFSNKSLSQKVREVLDQM